MVFGEKHFDDLVSEYVEHSLKERSHQSVGNVPQTGDWPKPEGDPPDLENVGCRKRLGSVLKYFERMAA